MTASGFILFDKPAGRTSFAALGGFKKCFPKTRVGHTGTLDSFATGLLIVVAGSYSRLAPWFVGLDKRYEAKIRFGTGTDTLDPSGDVTGEGPIPSEDALLAALPKFRGDIMQIPPEYSAIHVAGRRASEMALRGETVALSPRPVAIRSLELVSMEEGVASITVRCSSGTYIRSLARDIASSLGTCAHLAALRRTDVGPFSVRDAVQSPESASAADLRRLDPDSASRIGLNVGRLRAGEEAAFGVGMARALAAVTADLSLPGDVAVFSAAGDLLGILGRKAGALSYRLVLPGAEAAA